MGIRTGCLLIGCLAACGGGEGDEGPDAGVTGADKPCRIDYDSTQFGSESWFYFYDDQNRLIRAEGPDAMVILYEYAGYLLIRETSSSGYLVDYGYDARDNLITEETDDNFESFPGVDDRTTHTYDAADLRTYTVVDLGADEYPDGHSWYYYEAVRLVRQDVDVFGYGDVDHTVTYTYDPDGLLAMQVAEYSGGRGTFYTATYSYDDQRRLATIVYDFVDWVSTYTYSYEC